MITVTESSGKNVYLLMNNSFIEQKQYDIKLPNSSPSLYENISYTHHLGTHLYAVLPIFILHNQLVISKKGDQLSG